MTLERLPKKIYLEGLVKTLGLSDLPLHIAIDNILQFSKEYDLPLHFTNKITGTPLGTKLETCYTDVKGEELLIVGVKAKRKTFDEKEEKLILSADVLMGNSASTLRISLVEFTHKEEHFINISDKTTIHEPLPLCLEDVFCMRDDVIAFITKEDNVPSYIDKNSPYYAKELDLAIQLHKEMHINNYKPHLGNMEARVDMWLCEKKPESKESTARVKRLSTVISTKN